MSADILSNGQLSYAKAVPTGGQGAHGNATTVGHMDGLFSQDSVTVHSARRLVAVVNVSPVLNTVMTGDVIPILIS